MSKKCKITGKKPLVGNNVSHANNKTKRRQLPNLQNKSIKIRISTSALKSIDKLGLMPYLKKKGLSLKDIL